MNYNFWFLRELRAFDPKLFVVFDNRKQRYEVREWAVNHPTKRDARCYDLWIRKSNLIETVSEKDELLSDLGYRDLDRRILYSLKRSVRDSEDPERTLYNIDEANRILEEKGDVETEDASRRMAKEIWHFSKEPTVSMAYKGAR